MLRFVTLFVFILLFGVSAGLYHVKYSVDRMERQGLALKAKIADEQEAIRILEAEWSGLNQPARLQKLTERYLELAPVQVSQVVGFSALPEKPVDGAQDNMLAAAPAPSTPQGKILPITPVAAKAQAR